MALSATTLADELKAMGLYDNEPDAIAAWASAYRVYFEGATSSGVTIVPSALIAAEAAMITGLAGLSTSASTAIQSGVSSFWGAIIPAVAWVTVTAITPPALLASMGAALSVAFIANKEGKLDKDTSMDAISVAIHTNSLGGIAAWPPTPGGVGPQPII